MKAAISIDYPAVVSLLIAKQSTILEFLPFALGSALVCLLIFLLDQAFRSSIPRIQGIPELPHNKPFFGRLLNLGKNHAATFSEISRKYNWPVFQVRLGRRRVIILNTVEAAKEWIIKNQSAVTERPNMWTFHHILSSTAGPTIATSPWDDACKKRRRAVGEYLTRPAIQRSQSLLDLETCVLIEDMLTDSQNGTVEINPRLYSQRLGFNVMTMLAYGSRFDDIRDRLFQEIVFVSVEISKFRSTNNNDQDYVPLLRLVPSSKRSRDAATYRDKRDSSYMSGLLAGAENAAQKGSKQKSLVGDFLAEGKYSQDDIRCICVSLVSGGFETVANSVMAGIGILASPEGQEMQEKIYQEILTTYGSAQSAWLKCVVEDKLPYAMALVKELLRYYSPLPLITPREVNRDFEWKGIHIPKGVTVFMNGLAINHDPAAYGKDCDSFRPERWLEDHEPHLIGYTPPYNFSFGAGSRVCPAVNFSYRLICAQLVRLVAGFKIKASQECPPETHFVRYNVDPAGQAAYQGDYKIRLEARNIVELMGSIQGSLDATKGEVLIQKK